MERSEHLGASSSLLILVFVMLQLVSRMDCIELKLLRGNDSRCSYEDRDTCRKAAGSQCEWCELPQKCYHRDVANDLDASCHGSQRRQLTEVQECGNIASKGKCLLFDHCRWCRSDILNDGCFRSWDARRLPYQIFDCSKVTQN